MYESIAVVMKKNKVNIESFEIYTQIQFIELHTKFMGFYSKYVIERGKDKRV